MVHRPADARLLSNLVSHEKDYSKALNALLNASQASQASLAAYAAASPPATSRTILNVAAIFAAADDAHARYATAVEEWRDMLRGLHALEEEVGNVIRDREILVTRLIKASKSSKATERLSTSTSASHLRSPSTSSLNPRDSSSSYFSSFLSPSSHHSPPPTQPRSLAPTSTKLAAAQSELQACETHLAAKERELEVRRVQVIRDGLTLRSRIMAETGRTWGQLGQEAIHVVEAELGFRPYDEELHHEASEHDHHHNTTSTAATSVSGKDTPPGGYPASSSEGSVHKAGELRIPPAHAIESEIGMPMPTMNNNTTPSRRSSLRANATSGPPVPSKRHSVHGSSRPNSRLMGDATTPRQSRIIEAMPSGSSEREDLTQGGIEPSAKHPHRPHLQHVLPHGRVSWVSVTDTEEDWVDAGEGGDDLDDVFGTPALHGNGNNGSPTTTITEDGGVPIVTVPVNQQPNSNDHHHHAHHAHHADPSTSSASHLNPHSKPFVPSSAMGGSHTDALGSSRSGDKDLPPAPPALGGVGLYRFASAPGSVFDSEEYKASRAAVLAAEEESAAMEADGRRRERREEQETPRKAQSMSYAAVVSTPPRVEVQAPEGQGPTGVPSTASAGLPPPIGTSLGLLSPSKTTAVGAAAGDADSATLSSSVSHETRTVRPPGEVHTASTMSLHDASPTPSLNSVTRPVSIGAEAEEKEQDMNGNGNHANVSDDAQSHMGAVSEVEFVGTATRGRVEAARGVEVVEVGGPVSPGGVSGDGGAPPPLQPPVLWAQPTDGASNPAVAGSTSTTQQQSHHHEHDHHHHHHHHHEVEPHPEHMEEHLRHAHEQHHSHHEHTHDAEAEAQVKDVLVGGAGGERLRREEEGNHAGRMGEFLDEEEHERHHQAVHSGGAGAEGVSGGLHHVEHDHKHHGHGYGTLSAMPAGMERRITEESEGGLSEGDQRGSRFLEEDVVAGQVHVQEEAVVTTTTTAAKPAEREEESATSSIVDAEGGRWKVVENPRYSAAAPAATTGLVSATDHVAAQPPAVAFETRPLGVPAAEGGSVEGGSQSKGKGGGVLKRGSLKAAFLSPISGPMVDTTASSTGTLGGAQRSVGGGEGMSTATATAAKPAPPPPAPIFAPAAATTTTDAQQQPPPPPQHRPSVFKRMFGRGRSSSMSKDKSRGEPGEAVGTAQTEHPPPVPALPAASTVHAQAPPPPAGATTTTTSTSGVASAAAAPRTEGVGIGPTAGGAVSASRDALAATAPTSAGREVAGAPRGAEEEAVVVHEVRGGAAQEMPEPVGMPVPHPAPAHVAVSEPVVAAPTPSKGGKLSKRDRERASTTDAAAPTHSHSGFLGGLRGFFSADLAHDDVDKAARKASGAKGKKKGPGSSSAASSEGLPRSQTEPVVQQYTATETVWHTGAEGAGGGVASAASVGVAGGGKHQRSKSGSTFRVLFGLPPSGSTAKLSKAPAGDAERVVVEGNEEEGETSPYRVVDNDLELEKRRERLLEQHKLLASGGGGGSSVASEGSPVRRKTNKLERRQLNQDRPLQRSRPVAPSSSAHYMDGMDAGRRTSIDAGEAHLVSAQAPGRLNVEDLQAQARAGGAGSPGRFQQHHRSSSSPYLPASYDEPKGWSTRTDKNLKALSWREDDDLVAGREKLVALAGGGQDKRRMEFGPVVLDDHLNRHEFSGLRGAEGVVRRPSAATPAQQRHAGSVVDLGYERERRRKTPERRSASVEVNVGSPGVDRFAFAQSGGGGGGTLSSPSAPANVVKPRRSTSLTTAPPAIAALRQQNQYGVTVLAAGGDHPSGNIAEGGWGASGGTGASLARNPSVVSAASAPTGGRRAQASLGQGMPNASPRRLSGVDATTARKASSGPVAMPGVPGVVSAAMPSIPRAPPPVSLDVLQSSSMLVIPSKGETSLVSIVEDLARGNRIAEEQLRVLKSGGTLGKMDLHVVPAPVRVPRDMLTGPGPEPKATFPSSASTGGDLSRRVSAVSSASRPARSPLKSALRNTTPSGSRTPSPMGVQRHAGGGHGQPVASALGHQVSRGELGDDEDDDEAYETAGDGVSGDEGARRAKAGGAPPPVGSGTVNPATSSVGPAVSRLPASTSTESTPQRRKSVRVSLQPTFSPSPPAMDDDEDKVLQWKPVAQDKPTRSTSKYLGGGGGGGSGYGTRGAKKSSGVRDMWQDSDEEDNEYTRAKAMLTRAKQEERAVFATARSAAAAPHAVVPA